MTALTLRPYQIEAREAVEAAWLRGVQRPAVVLPTGAGKTVNIADLSDRWVGRHRMSAKQRVLVLAHRDELIEQAAAKIRTMAPTLRVGIVKAERDNCTADVVVASVQTLRNERRRHRIVHVGLVVIDECHHATADTYRLIMEHYGCFSEYGARLVGFTATLSRSDGVSLGDIWQDVVYVKGIAEMVRDGYLVRPRGIRIQVSDLDLGRVRKSRGDYADGALGKALEGSLAPQRVAEAYQEHAAARQGILFAPTVSCAETYGAALATVGLKSELVHGEMPAGARRDALERFRQGETQILSNCMVLTEGTDLPMASTIVVGRPTKSQGLYTQMVGRGLRLWPGKSDALVLDVVGASARNALVTPVELFGDKLAELETEEERQELEALKEIELDTGEEIVTKTAEEQIFIDGYMTAVEVDLFHNSRSAWRRTYGGINFLPAGDRLIVLKPQDNGLWGVVWCHKFQRLSGWVAQDVADMGYAMAFAEANVSQSEQLTASRERAWRAKPVSEKQKNFARRYGIIVHEGMRGGELSELLDTAIGSARIDPYLRPNWRR
jgi:superfamily II DNA or RNA helicase